MRIVVLRLLRRCGKLRFMKRPMQHPRPTSSTFIYRVAFVLAGVLFCIANPLRAMAEPSASAVAGYNLYVRGQEERLAQQHSDLGFLAGVDDIGGTLLQRLRGGEFVVEPLTPANADEIPGALLRHWRGTAFVPGANAADFERLMRDFGGYPRVFAPQVLQSRVLSQSGDSYSMTMRVRQQHIITVVMDTAYDVRFGRLDTRHGYSASRSTRIDEIASPGTRSEHALSAADEHGFLWRQNTYWSYAERDGGLLIQIESVSLSRAVPHGLGWAVGPFVNSVPRESLEFTLHAVCNALKH
jgi:hypothetical protein